LNFVASFLKSLHQVLGDTGFIALSLIISGILSFWAIPTATHLMVNNAAGLAGALLGKKWRTLVINASTNNPEAISMLVSFGLRKVGGFANPLGSLFANIYLLYGVAFGWVMLKYTVKGEHEQRRTLWRLIVKEKALCFQHLCMALLMFVIGNSALRYLAQRDPAEGAAMSLTLMAMLGLLLLSGVLLFFIFERFLKNRRPELFDDMDDSGHEQSWKGFLLGTAGVIVACYLMNEMFLAWSEIYAESLQKVFGLMVFAMLHWFLGALITSLPEMTVAIHNLEKQRSPDLNTALGSVSYSNMVNLCIALLGLLIWGLLSTVGVQLTW
jgi:hypothetical protein